jgi:tRNA (uracil-5-)-methyltransferase
VSLKPWEVDPVRYEALLQSKVAEVSDGLSVFDPPAPAVYRSTPEAYRARAEFRIWHQGDDLFYAMFDPGAPRDPVRVDSFPAALPSIQRRMAPLRSALRGSDTLRRKLFQAEFMGSRDDEVVLTLAYHRPLDEDWQREAAALAQELALSIVGRSRREKRVIGRDYLAETFTVQGRDYRFRQYEQSFAQPNAAVNEQMLNWAADRVAGSAGDLLELYCGNGNFTLPLARHFRRVLATELSKSGTRAARENLLENAVHNVDVIRLSAEEVSQAMAGTRVFRRLADLPQPLAEYELDTVFVDPPRAGLDAATLACVRGIRRIVYVSCNPQTLRDNLSLLCASHRIADLAFFDQFPYTHHLESGVVLQRRQPP